MPAKKTAQNRVRMTKEAIEKLVAPANGRTYYYDSTVRGLAICVTAAGTKTWYLYRKVHGRPERIKIGPWPEWTVRQAQDEAERIRGRVASGENPAEERRQQRLLPTLDELFKSFISQPSRSRSKKPRADRTNADYRHQHDKHLCPWHHRRIDTITKAEVEALHGSLAAETETDKARPYAANRVLALLKAMLNMAVDDGLLLVNPASRVRPLKEEKRKRRLSDHEMTSFFRALDAEQSETMRDFFYVALLTGARRSNIQSMRWVEVNLDKAEWIIPRTKNGESHRVHLPAKVVAILRQREAMTVSPWVFPRRGDHGDKYMNSPKGAWKQLLHRAKENGTDLTGLRIHDLRRTLGSVQADQGASLTIIGASLGHKSPQATVIYARPDHAAVDASVDSAAAAILAAAKPRTKRKRA